MVTKNTQNKDTHNTHTGKNTRTQKTYINIHSYEKHITHTNIKNHIKEKQTINIHKNMKKDTQKQTHPHKHTSESPSYTNTGKTHTDTNAQTRHTSVKTHIIHTQKQGFEHGSPTGVYRRSKTIHWNWTPERVLPRSV